MAERKFVDEVAMAKNVEMTKQELAKKQDKLTQGKNITINGTTISATDTTYSKLSEFENDTEYITDDDVANNAMVEANRAAIATLNGSVSTAGSVKKQIADAVPTKLSDLNNDAGYQTATQVSDAINAATLRMYKYKGSVATYSALPSSGQAIGDAYNIEAADTAHDVKAGDNAVWNGTGWDIQSGKVDLSGYYTKSQIDTKLAGKVEGAGITFTITDEGVLRASW